MPPCSLVAAWLLAGVAIAEDLPTVTAADAAPIAGGGVRVTVVDETDVPVPVDLVRVVLERADHPSIPLSGDPAGTFDAAAIPPGTWRVSVHGERFLDAAATIVVASGEVVEQTIALTTTDDALVVVVDGLSDADALRRSAEAVTVIETEHAQRQSADLGEVIARTQGVGVRRGGGLGSASQFSLAGLTGDQIRFFLDGVPLALAGFPLGVANVPVGLVERIEVYRGVVPVRFGADALGGAVNLVSEGSEKATGGSLSYQGGSYDTHRVAAQAHHTDARSGVRVAGSAYLDASRNDYPIDVEVADAEGRVTPATVRRFHDRYVAGGGSVELGVVDRRWADALSVRAFGAAFRKELQHNVVMTVPYGEPVSRLQTAGVLARYRHRPSSTLGIDSYVGTTWTRRAFDDTATCVYDWFGQCVRQRAVAGEITTPAVSQVVRDQAIVGRARVTWQPHPAHALELSVTPSWFTRSGKDLLLTSDQRDPLTSQRDAGQVVTGLEHTVRAWHDRFENRAFVKHYVQWVVSEEPGFDGPFTRAARTTQRIGAGDGVRLDVGHGLSLKASYEWATRQPTPEQLFGDAVLVRDNLSLVPETSHNVNLGLTWQLDEPRAGSLVVDAQGFGRFARDLLVLLGTDRSYAWYNVYGARSVGLESAVSWTSPGDWVMIAGNVTWVDLRNTSDQGPFGDFSGDRVPNRPWLYANGSVSVGVSHVAVAGDRLTLDGYTRYVHPFYRGWESVGLTAFKQVVPAQLAHTIALTYAVDAGRARFSASVEVQDITDAKLFDYFGVQRPGRTVFGKVTTAF